MFLLKVINGQPELNKIVALSKIRGLFPENPFVSGFGNKVSPFTFYDSASPSFKFYIPDKMRCVNLFIAGVGHSRLQGGGDRA